MIGVHMGVGPEFGWQCLEVHTYFWFVSFLGSPEARISDGEWFFCNFSKLRSRSRIWEGRWRCRVAICGRRWRGMHRRHFQVPCGMAVRGGRRQSICHPGLHMSQRRILCSSNGLWHTWQWISASGGEVKIVAGREVEERTGSWVKREWDWIEQICFIKSIFGDGYGPRVSSRASQGGRTWHCMCVLVSEYVFVCCLVVCIFS